MLFIIIIISTSRADGATCKEVIDTVLCCSPAESMTVDGALTLAQQQRITALPVCQHMQLIQREKGSVCLCPAPSILFMHTESHVSLSLYALDK